MVGETGRDAVRTEDVEFVRRGDRPLLATLYHPPVRPAGGVPAIVDIHGGAWVSNDRSRNATLMRELASRGTFAMSVDFRMPPEAPYPASLQDIRAGLAWLQARTADYGIDPARLGLLGTSSGGHQALLVALRPDHPRWAGEGDANAAFVIACWPIVDTLQRYAMAKEKGMANLVRGHDLFWGSEAAMAEGSPQGILERGEPAATPPALLIQGTADDNIDHRTMEPFAEAYRRGGGQVTVRKFEGETHAFIRDDLARPSVAEAVDLIDRFIRMPGTFAA